MTERVSKASKIQKYKNDWWRICHITNEKNTFYTARTTTTQKRCCCCKEKLSITIRIIWNAFMHRTIYYEWVIMAEWASFECHWKCGLVKSEMKKTIKILLPYCIKTVRKNNHSWDIYLLFPNYVLQITVLFEWLAMAERNSKHLQRFKWIVKFVFKKFEHKWRKNVFSRSFFLQTCTYMTCAKYLNPSFTIS